MRPTTGTDMSKFMMYLELLQHPPSLSSLSDLSEVNRLYKVIIYINFMQNESRADEYLKTKAQV